MLGRCMPTYCIKHLPNYIACTYKRATVFNYIFLQYSYIDEDFNDYGNIIN